MSLPGISAPGLGCGAVIVRDGRILLMQRLKAPEAGHWGIPGGKVDFQEAVIDAVRRETLEETGLVLGTLSLLCHSEQFADGQHWYAPVFLSLESKGEALLLEPDKHAGIDWFTRQDLPDALTVPAIHALNALEDRRLF